MVTVFVAACKPSNLYTEKDNTMADRTQGIMNPLAAFDQQSEIMSALRSAFGPRSSKPPTLQEELEDLSQDRLEFILRIATFVKMAHQWNNTEPYHVLVERMYKRLDTDTKRLVAAILQDAEPIEEPDTPAPEKRAGARKKLYDDYQLAFDFGDTQQDAKADPETKADTATPETNMDRFMQKMAMSESSLDPNAEITLDDGRTFTGLYQFGDARLSDYRKATGAKFTTPEFKEDEALQQKVAEWHFQDLAEAVDALGSAADSYDRDGLMAVAHLGGVSGMEKYVRTKGEYNPADALGTSLSDYYEKFSA